LYHIWDPLSITVWFSVKSKVVGFVSDATTTQQAKIRDILQALVVWYPLGCDQLEMDISGYLLDQSFDDSTHDLGFLQADLQDFPVIDSRLRRVLDDPPFKLDEARREGERNFLSKRGRE
jgi:hypothetical protein